MTAGLESARRAQLAEHDRRGDQSRPQADAPTFQPGHILEAKTGGYLVLSRSTEGVWYLVHGRSCSCPAGRSGHERCWHRTQVAKFVAALNADRKRPVFAPNVAAMCD